MGFLIPSPVIDFFLWIIKALQQELWQDAFLHVLLHSASTSSLLLGLLPHRYGGYRPSASQVRFLPKRYVFSSTGIPGPLQSRSRSCHSRQIVRDEWSVPLRNRYPKI